MCPESGQVIEEHFMSATRTLVLFVSHGSPMFALDPGTTGPALVDWVQSQAPASQLRGIVVMSPH